jgi:peptidyl-prolyl cis-trans isomerase C
LRPAERLVAWRGLTRSQGTGLSLGLGLSLATAAGLGGCGGGSGGEGPRQGRAVVSIAASAVDAIMRERGLSREQALELGGEDALLAKHLEEQAPELARWLQRLALARRMLGALAEEARAGGPPTDAEVAAITEARFWELDRPRMVQVVHAVVLSSEEDPAARELAERVAAATARAATGAEFQAAARAVDPGRFKVEVEALSPVTEDGRAVDPSSPPPAGPSVQHYDRDFSAAAQRLSRPGEQSPVLKSPFGYHVLYARAIIDALQPSLDDRRRLLHDEIMSQRAAALSAALFERQRRELVPSQSRSALASMQQLSVQQLSMQQLSAPRVRGQGSAAPPGVQQSGGQQ